MYCHLPALQNKNRVGQTISTLILPTFILILLLLILPTPSFCKTTLKVGVYNNKPIIFSNENGVADGLFIDILDDIAAEEGWDIVYVPGHFSELYDLLQSGTIDLLPAVAYSREREELIDFARETVIANWGEIYSSQNVTITSLVELEGRVIAGKQGDIHLKALKRLTESFNISCRFLEADEYETVFEMLNARYVDIGVVNRLYGNENKVEYDIKDTPIIFNPIELRFAVPKGKSEIVRNTIDTYLVAAKSDQFSPYYHAINKWLVVDTSNPIPVWFWQLGALVIGVAMAFFVTALLLRFQVKKQTLQLVEANNKLKEQIRERKKIEENLRSSEVRYRDLVEQSPIGLSLATVEGQVISANSAYARIIGYSLEETLLLHSIDITSEAFSAKIDSRLRKLEINESYGPYEKDYIHKDGHLVPTRLNSLMVLRDGVRYIWSSVEDITELKKAEAEKEELLDQLRQSHKMEAIGTLSGGIAHDFNNILVPILGYAEIARAVTPEDSPTRRYLEQILVASQRAKELVKHILYFNRKEVKERGPIQIHKIVEEALKLLRASLPTTVEMVQNIDSECGNILADPTQMHQVIMNLCTNSAHAMDADGGTLEVSLVGLQIGVEGSVTNPNIAPGQYAQLTVTDNGTGIDQVYLDKIFDPYFTTKEVGEGSGIGLAVVSGIVKSHDGEITVDSEYGVGTTFTLYFPVVGENVVGGETALPTFVKGSESILFVDDEKSVVDFMKINLERLGYSVIATTDSFEALQLFKSQPNFFDIVISDQTMPGLTGDKLAKELREIRPEIPVIICTGFSPKMDSSNPDFGGVDAVIVKPVETHEIANKIRQVLDGF